MKICILGLGVIGTTYGYAFQKAGHQVEHFVREGKRDALPDRLSIHLLDGREHAKGIEAEDTYAVSPARPHTDHDFILVSVACGALQAAVDTIEANGLGGSVLLFCNFWNDRAEIDAILGKRPYVIGFPTAGGQMAQGKLDCVLFDHIMLEHRDKAAIPNYDDLLALLHACRLKEEIPDDMAAWIWLHMAINAGVTSTAARTGRLDDPHRLALDLMGDSRALAEAVRTIRETVQVVRARNVDLKKYGSELLPYRLPAALAGVVMKKMFAGNELTRRIMTLHSDIDDILYGCSRVYQTAREKGLDLPLYYEKMERIFAAAGTGGRVFV